VPLSDEATAELLALGVDVLLDEPMAAHCSFGVGGPADVYVCEPSAEHEALLRAWARRNKLPVTRWTGVDNEIASDSGVKGVVLGPASMDPGMRRRLFEEPKRGGPVDTLVARCGMRGIRLRGARVSPDDGNAVLNEGGATAKDVLLLMDSLRRRVARDFGLQLVDSLVLIGRRRP
jgi:UDP-N-acetylenolpyruvoylglucosamine reductase